MEERYEIRGKIGQGGLGAVYKGYDTRMNREVAIKRISVTSDDPALQEESTRQLIKEAGALASLQHPHIVTIYDVGSDEDGPYVVMELINGKTLDELIERAPLTWPDFRELAIQTLEALIAAQELDLIHSDIKPSNLMLTWLPSGKFQMKIVDFGLATLTQSQTKEELEELEAVFGSIFFMAPEQFERVPIDARTDIYAMGCVYYQALTCTYPFRGETGNEVMIAHLHHTVIPIQDLRQGIPKWACDWIMWMLNRMPDDRPASAREALQVFLQNDKNPSPTVSLGRAAPVTPVGPRPRMSGQAGPATPSRPILDPRMAPPGYVPPAPEPEPIPEPPLTTTAPQPLLPPEGSKPSIHTGPHDIPEVVSTPTVALNPTGRLMPTRTVIIPQKKKSGMGLKIVGAAVLGIVIVVLGLLLRKRIDESKVEQRYSILVRDAAKPEVAELPVSGAEFAQFLKDAADADTDAKRQAFFQAIHKAKPNDGSDFDTAASDFIAKTVQILPEVREQMIRQVLAKRVTAAMVPALTEFARSTNDAKSATAILEITRSLADDGQFDAYLSIARYHKNADFRKAAEESAIAVLKKSKGRGKLLGNVAGAVVEETDPKIRESMLRIQSAGSGG
ncbi:MAG: protein kinase [Verrucomicrobiota bacterium]